MFSYFSANRHVFVRELLLMKKLKRKQFYKMKYYLLYLSLLLLFFLQACLPFRCLSHGLYQLNRLSSRLRIYAFDNEQELTRLLNAYDFKGAYDVIRQDPMLKISKDNAIKLLNNIKKLEPESTSSSQVDQSKKGTESCSLVYRRLEKQKVLRGFNCIGDVYPENSSDISPAKLEALSGLPISSLTPKTRTTYWRLAGIFLCLAELIFGFYYDIDPIFTLIPITIFAFGFDQLALKGALFETIYRTLFPEYKRKVITHEAGHFLIAYLLGLPINGVVTNAWEARKYPEIQGSAGTIFFDAKFSEELEAQKVTRTSLDRLSIAFMAGIAAEAIEFGVCEGGAADEKSLISLFTSITPAWNILRIQGQARWAVTQCILLLREHKDAFKAVIKALEEEKELGEIIFELEQNLPAELPSTKRLEQRIIQRKEKDRELLFRMVQKKTWNVGGIQESFEKHNEVIVEPLVFEEPKDPLEEDPVAYFEKTLKSLQRAVAAGDLDVKEKTSGGLWLNNLRSLEKPSVEESVRNLFEEESRLEQQRKQNSTASPSFNLNRKDDLTVEDMLRSHRGYMMKEIELKQTENEEKIVKIEQRLSSFNKSS